MFIQTETTPNPATLKFLPGVRVMETGTAEFKDPVQAAASPLAEKVFGLGGVQGVFLGQDFISVTKTDGTDWAQIKTPILAAIMDHFTMGLPLFKEGRTPAPMTRTVSLEDEIASQIIELLDTRVRPAVAQDGGDIEFFDYDAGIVYLKMRGACSGCPSSTATLKIGIENMLKHFIPEIQEVRAVE